MLIGEDNNNVLDSIEYIDINENKEWIILKSIDFGYIWYPAKISLILTLAKDKIIIGGGDNNDEDLFKDCFYLNLVLNVFIKDLI